MTKLALFGAIHFDRRRKVVDEFSRFSDGADALFVEYPADGISIPGMGRALLHAPMSTVGMLIVTLIQLPGYALLNRDVFPAEVVAARQIHEERDVPLYPVDEHPIAILGTVGLLRILTEWAVLLGLIALDPPSSALTLGVTLVAWLTLTLVYSVHRLLWVVAVVPTLVVACWYLLSRGAVELPLVLASLGALAYTVVRTLTRRNEVMLDRIQEHCEREGYERACLTTGKAHLSGLVSAADTHGITVAACYVPKWLRDGTVVAADIRERFSTRQITGDPDTAGAVFGRRVAALLVDWVAVAIVAFVAGALVAGVCSLVFDERTALLVGLPSGWLLGWSSYWVGVEAYTSQSVGKRLLGLVVVTEDGSLLSRRGAVVRTLLRPIDALGGYALGGLVSLVSTDGQRLGDHVAGTLVVRVDD